jgi:hypothetical protein
MKRECSLRKQVNGSEYVVFVQILQEGSQAFWVAVEGGFPSDELFDPELTMRAASGFRTIDEAEELAWQCVYYLEKHGWVYAADFSTF